MMNSKDDKDNNLQGKHQLPSSFEKVKVIKEILNMKIILPSGKTLTAEQVFRK